MPERSSNALLNVTALFVLLTGGFLLVQQPIKSLRPQGNTGIVQPEQTKQLSRLWQDPFESARTTQKNQNETNAPGSSAKSEPSYNKPENIFYEMIWAQVLGSGKDFLKNNESPVLDPQKVKDALSKIRVLAVMVPGKPYQDQVERRIRYRVALVHGLLEAGYHPSDAESIGCLSFEPTNTKNNNSKFDEVRKLWKSEVEKDIPVPYEWYHKRATEEDKSEEDVLVLWIDEDSFAAAPMMLLNLLCRRINETREEAYRAQFPSTLPIQQKSSSQYGVCGKMFDSVVQSFLKSLNGIFRHSEDVEQKPNGDNKNSTPNLGTLSFQVVGPYSSTTLHRIREEGKIYAQNEHAKKVFSSNLTFYNYSATSQEKGQREELWVRSGRVFTEELLKEEMKVSMYHLVSSDAMLMQAMHRELKLRNWAWKSSSPKDIILLSENDTVYGRTLPEAFEGVNKYVYKGEYECYRYGYLRGIDGTTAADAKAQEQKRLAGTQSSPNEKGTTQLPSPLLPGKHSNPPVGNNQLDYIARLIMEIKQNHPRPFAVGILGSDPYDKLMLLQSLRLHFPDALFFTTDLEAQYLDLQSVHTAHGLLVASSYGLALHPNIQKNTPPFRGNYQTALFHAVLTAINDKKTEKKDDNKANEEDKNLFLKQQSLPRVFEIGWYNAVDLTMESQETQKNYYKSLTNFQWDRYNYSETWKELNEQNPIFYKNNEDEKASLHPFSPRLTMGWNDFYVNYGWFFPILLLPIVVLVTVNFKLVRNLVVGEWLKEMFPNRIGNSEKETVMWRIIYATPIVLPLLMMLFAYWVIHYNHTNPLVGGEPFFFWEGNSYWTILVAQFLVIYLGIIFLFVALRIFQKVRLDVSKNVFPENVETKSLSYYHQRTNNLPQSMLFFRIDSKSQEEKLFLDITEYWASLTSIVSYVLSWFKKRQKQNSQEEPSKDSSIDNKSLWETWIEYLKVSKTRWDDIRTYITIAFLFSVLFFLFMFWHSDWTTFRGDGAYFGISAVFLGMFGAYTMLNILTGIVAASSLFGIRFVTKIADSKDSLLNDNDNEGKDFSLDNSEHFRIVKLIGEWTHTTRSIIWFPVVLLLVLTLVRIFVFENFGRGEVIRLCYVVAIASLIFIPVLKLRTKARNLRHILVDDLKNKLVDSHASDGTKPKQKEKKQANGKQNLTGNSEQIKIVIEEIEKYQKGIYSNNFWYPVVSVLVVLSGGISSPLLLEFFFR